jgi:hypothetical protein
VCAGRSVTAMIDIIQTHSSSKTRSVILMQGDFLQSYYSKNIRLLLEYFG